MTRTLLCMMWLVLAPALADAQPRELAYAEAMQLAVDENIGLLIDGMNREAEAFGATQARQPYVPVVFVEPEYALAQVIDRTADPPAVLREGRVDTGAGVRWSNRWGTSLALRAATTVWYSNTPPIPLSSVDASVNQALWRGGWRSGTLLDAADLAVELQRQLFVGQVNELLRSVDAAYWELAYAQADVEIKERSRDRAQSQYDDTKENIARGLLAPGDIFVVEENLVIFEEQLLRSQEALTLAQLRLGRLLQLEATAASLRATDSLDAPQAKLSPVQDAVGVALRESPRVVAQRVAVRRAKVTLAYDRNQSRPVLDLTAGVGLSSLNEEYGGSWSETLSAQNPTVRVGVYLEVPLVSGPYRARVKRSETELRQEELELERIEHEVAYDVRELLAQLEARDAALGFAQRRIDLAEKKLETEQDKYARGLSTLTDLVRFQRDLDSARISERRARVDVVALRARLGSVQGILHRWVGVEVQ